MFAFPAQLTNFKAIMQLTSGMKNSSYYNKIYLLFHFMDILQHFKFMNWRIRGFVFDVTNPLYDISEKKNLGLVIRKNMWRASQSEL